MTRKCLGFIIMALACAQTVFAAPDSAQTLPLPPNDTLASDSLPPIEKMPVLTTFIKADYPSDLVKQGVEGAVTLEIVVNDSGRVDSVAVVKGIHPRLDSAAARAAKAFVFSPAIAGGQPVPVLMEYVYRFSLLEVVTKIERFVNVSGKLYERGTRAPIVNATIALFFKSPQTDTSIKVPMQNYLARIGSFDGQFLQDGSLITTVDSTGAFSFQSVPSCTVVVKVIAPDFENYVDQVLVKHGEATELLYRLERMSIGENEIVVYGKAEKKEVAQRTLTLNEVRKIPGLGGDAVKVIQALPGVARSAFNLGPPIIRGAGSGDSRFFLDGVKLPNLFHFGGLTSTYNSTALQNIDLYPGGWGPRYGGALGGIVEITGRKAKTDRYHGYLDANLLDASFLVEGPISKKISFIVAARRSYMANVLKFTLDAIGVSLPFTVVPYYWDYLARTDISLIKNQHVYFTLFGSKDAMDLISNEVRGGTAEIDAETNRARMDQFFHLGILGWDWDISPKIKNELRFSADFEKAGVGIFGMVNIKAKGREYYLRDQLTLKHNDALIWRLGVDADIYPYEYRLIFPDANLEIVRDTSSITFGPTGAYASLEWKPLERLTLIPGLRYDYYPELIHDGGIVPEFWHYRSFDNNRGISGEPSARMTARYEHLPGRIIKASIGSYNQTPQPIGQAIDKDWGEPSLPTEKGAQYVGGYEWRFSDVINADLQVYYNRQWDNARYANAKDIAKGNSKKFYSDGMARMGGMEILIKHEQSKRFFGWVAYSLSRSERWNNELRKWELFSSDQTHYLQLIGNYKLTPTQDIGTRLRFVSGDPTTPVLGVKEFNATYGYYEAKYGERNSDRMAPYIGWDLRYEKQFTYNKWLWSLYLDVTHVENLFNKGYRSPEFAGYQWNYDYTEKVIFADITRPALGLKVEF
jgi:TonB family protein